MMTSQRLLDQCHVVATFFPLAELRLLLLLLLVFPSMLLAQPAATQIQNPAGADTTAGAPLDALPLLFRDAADPLNPDLLFRADGANGRVGFSRTAVSLSFKRGEQEMVVALEFEGGNRNSPVTATEGAGVVGNIYRFTGSATDATRLRHYSEIFYQNVYDGIDIRYYGVGAVLKYDCLLEPGADPSLVKMRYRGVEKLEINGEGDLEILTAWGRLVERRPYVYQNIDGEQREVAASFRLIDESSFGFEITGEYDRSRTLVIDPMILAWSTFVGGRGDGYINDMVLDGQGNVYATGWYNNTFPTTPGVFNTAYSGGLRDCYVFKLSSDGRTLLFSTYLGGTDEDGGNAIRLGPDSTIYVGGQTRSVDFPALFGSYNASHPGTYDCFLLRLSRTGDRLLYSAVFGGERTDTINRIAVGADGAATATGSTNSANFPTTPGAYNERLSLNGNAADLFVTRLSPDGRSLLFSTYIGGTGTDCGTDLAVDSDGETVVTGLTISQDFPTTAGAYDESHNSLMFEDAFLLRLSASGQELRYSTLLGGSGADGAKALAIAPDGKVIIAGYAGSGDFPVSANAFDRQHSVLADGFVAVFDNNGSRLVASTFLGSGNAYDELQGIALDADGSIFVAGRTSSSNPISTVCPLDVASRGRVATSDIYIARINADLTSVLFADYFGGDLNDYGTRIALSNDQCRRELVISLTSHSIDFPTTSGAFQETKLNLGEDQPVVLKIRPTVMPEFSAEVNCSIVSFTDKTQGSCIWGDPAWLPTTWLWDFGDGTTSTERNPVHVYRSGGSYRVVLLVGCPRDSFVSTITVDDARQPMVAHMDSGAVVAPGDIVGVPMMLDETGDGGPIMSLSISMRYDYSTVRPVNISTLASDSLFWGSLLAGWQMTIETNVPGHFAARFDAPSAALAVTGPGRLLYPRFLTYIRPDPKPISPWSDTTTMSFEIDAGARGCSAAFTEPGLVRLEMCGFSTRLIETTLSRYALDAVLPNPFAGSMEIRYSLGLDGPTLLTVNDALGNRVVTLLDSHLAAGTYSTHLSAIDLPAGVYYIRLSSGDWSATTRVVKQ